MSPRSSPPAIRPTQAASRRTVAGPTPRGGDVAAPSCGSDSGAASVAMAGGESITRPRNLRGCRRNLLHRSEAAIASPDPLVSETVPTAPPPAGLPGLGEQALLGSARATDGRSPVGSRRTAGTPGSETPHA